MVILIDTNVALDFLTMRQPYYEDARTVIRICAEDEIKGCIAFHSLPNIYYIVTRNLEDFKNSQIKAILPREFIEMMKRQRQNTFRFES